MHTTGISWKTYTADLVGLAQDVRVSRHSGMSSRTAAQCLSGVVSLIAQRFGAARMQAACAELVRFDQAWTTSFGVLPCADGYVAEPIELLATVARGLLPLAGASALRAALSYWATESDPAAWMNLAK
jgi:hypothetical protein